MNRQFFHLRAKSLLDFCRAELAGMNLNQYRRWPDFFYTLSSGPVANGEDAITAYITQELEKIDDSFLV